jgi:hypothetical protein
MFYTTTVACVIIFFILGTVYKKKKKVVVTKTSKLNCVMEITQPYITVTCEKSSLMYVMLQLGLLANKYF